jgi:isopentenyldiphosphate isomerase
MSFLDRIRECNAHEISRFRPFCVAGQQIGWVRHDLADRLAGFDKVFSVMPESVVLREEIGGFEARSAAMAEVLAVLREEGMVPAWRDESYPVVQRFGDEPLLRMERAGVPVFGIRAFGVHMNGFVRRRNDIEMWIARRSRSKPTFPGMLDNTVAGGQPFGLTLAENLVKECGEEASIPPELAARATPVGAVSYMVAVEEGLKPGVQYCFDLELPADLAPRPNDDEIEEFYLWPIEKVAEIVRETTEFKFNCNLVLIDFLIRHGLIGPENPDYIDIVHGLRQ